MNHLISTFEFSFLRFSGEWKNLFTCHLLLITHHLVLYG